MVIQPDSIIDDFIGKLTNHQLQHATNKVLSDNNELYKQPHSYVAMHLILKPKNMRIIETYWPNHICISGNS